MLKAIIFDLDGVICFTDEYHYSAWKTLADQLGIYFDREINNRLRGVSRMESLDIILSYKPDMVLSVSQKETLAQQKNTLYKKSLALLSPANLSPEVKNTLAILRERGFLLAIGSSSKNAPYILERLGLAGYFDAISDGNNITHSKPNPEVFIKAAEMMGLTPSECLVVEDAISGAKAGLAGGFKVACVGDAAKALAGDFNLKSFNELLNVTAALAIFAESGT
ncbi:MAG: beta-phosphoglucomutase [Oscillospiraceae bacterium]